MQRSKCVLIRSARRRARAACLEYGSLPFLNKIRLVCLPAAEPAGNLCTMSLVTNTPIAERPPTVGVDDLVIVPLVVIAVAVSKLLKGVLSILIYVLDYAFPILLQLMRIPLLAARLFGDGMEFFLEGVVRCLPVSSAKRDAWRARVRQQWIWLRRNISYQAFEQALHHAFEAGMAWVFRKCRRLTPSAALLVLALAFLWLPISFGTSDGAARTPHCARELVTGLDATAAPLRNPSSLRANCSYCRSTRLLGCRQKNIQLCRGSSSS